MSVRVTTDRLDRRAKLQEWISKLHAVGGDVEPLAEVQEHLSRSSEIQALRQQAHDSEGPRTKGGVIAGLIQVEELPSLADVVNEVRSIATESILITDPRGVGPQDSKPLGVRVAEEVLEILREAALGSADLAWRAFARRGDGNLDLVRPAYAAHADALIAAVGRLPERVTSLELAARSGTADAWLEAEEHYAAIFQIRDLVEDWHHDGIVPKAKKLPEHGTDAYFYDDPAAAYAASGSRAQHSSLSRRSFRNEAAALAAGGANIRTVAEMASRPLAASEQDDPQGRTWDASELQHQGRRREALAKSRIFAS